MTCQTRFLGLEAPQTGGTVLWAAFGVPVREGAVFMKLRRELAWPRAKFEDAWVVVVDALKFQSCWIATGEFSDVSNVPPADWIYDGKYPRAAEKFALGRQDPVPIITVYPRFEGAQFKISMDDGVTRTMWLLTNGATDFPVLCRSRQEADMLWGRLGCGTSAPPMEAVGLLFEVERTVYQ